MSRFNYHSSHNHNDFHNRFGTDWIILLGFKMKRISSADCTNNSYLNVKKRIKSSVATICTLTEVNIQAILNLRRMMLRLWFKHSKSIKQHLKITIVYQINV
ncbi:hypothetical protein BpHYR1_004206 [Brachionus plicatilis]|uniref:Uncharacterized protein n=1 Tax=Brachionus plicatilis TaxID=10195 RepID=A0A3M7R1N5_BRAPC|nr:hypothetical protein BpHYR1_004206 [Brachionus plicatilis]